MPDTLRMENVTKKFGDFTANDHISLHLKQGEILALLGENGAGKTTLMNILYGLYTPTSGKIFLNGAELKIHSPLHAIELGIGMVHQHFMLIPAFKTWQNVVLGLRDEQRLMLKEKTAIDKIMKIAGEYSLQIYPHAKISELSVGLQQQVEILKVLYRKSKLLILDEPTGVLTPIEKEKLFITLKSLAKSGVSIIFISHKLDEVMEISDRVEVLRVGKNAGGARTKDVDKVTLARMMVGRDVVLRVEKAQNKSLQEKVLQVRDLSIQGNRRASTIEGLNFDIYAGEVIGVAGVDGNGQSELAEAIFGLRRVTGGSIHICGVHTTNCKPKQIIRNKTAYIPEDRKQVGTVQDYTIDKNMILKDVESLYYCKHGLIDYKRLKKDTDKVIQEFDIRVSSRNWPVGLLSGGNVQKVILARELNAKPKLLLAMHPTRGLDVGALEFIHKKILEAKASGTAVLLISAEMEEILSLSDKVVVMSNGRMSRPLEGDELTMEHIGLLMGGETIDEEAPDGHEV